jgi:hypothetical protein
MLKIRNGYVCRKGKKYSEMNFFEKAIYSIELKRLKAQEKKPPFRVVKP